jgi:hypothetical protein
MIKLKNHAPLAILTVSAIVAAGCGSDSPSAPGTGSPLDLSAVISQMSTGTLSGLPGAGAAIGIPASAATPTIAPSACQYSSTSQGFVCPSIASSGLSFNATYWLYDASGHSQTQADKATTASVRAVVDASGTLNGTAGQVSGSMTLANHSDLTMNGLLGNTRTLNGTSTGHDSLTAIGSTTTTVVVDLTTIANDVIVPATQQDGASWPLSGTLTIDARTVTKAGSLPTITANAHAVVTFNGTSLVNVSGTVAGIPTTCRIDLTGKAAPACI